MTRPNFIEYINNLKSGDKLSGFYMICDRCGLEFHAERSTARFCSNACQKAAKRAE